MDQLREIWRRLFNFNELQEILFASFQICLRFRNLPENFITF